MSSLASGSSPSQRRLNLVSLHQNHSRLPRVQLPRVPTGASQPHRWESEPKGVETTEFVFSLPCIALESDRDFAGVTPVRLRTMQNRGTSLWGLDEGGIAMAWQSEVPAAWAGMFGLAKRRCTRRWAMPL